MILFRYDSQDYISRGPFGHGPWLMPPVLESKNGMETTSQDFQVWSSAKCRGNGSTKHLMLQVEACHILDQDGKIGMKGENMWKQLNYPVQNPIFGLLLDLSTCPAAVSLL